MASRDQLLLRFDCCRGTIAAKLAVCLACVVLLPSAVHALDPSKRLTQYMHTTWRIQDGSLPTDMFSITQTADGFLWLSSLSQGMYRFDGVRFVPWSLSTKGGWNNTISNILGDRAGGLWIVTERDIIHLKNGAVTSSVELKGLQSSDVSEDPDGSLWVARSSNSITDAPLCHVTDRGVKCFGKADGIPIAPVDSLLADGKGGFWLGGQTTLVHWHGGVSDLYRIEALKSNVGQYGINSLALGPDGSLWVGILAEGPGLGLGRLIEGTVTPFKTPTFDGSKVVITNLTFDSDGNLWVATAGKGVFRICGNVVDHYGRAEGLSGDTVFTLFEDRERIVWAATTNGIDSFRDPRVTTFSATEGLGKDAASGVLASKDGTIWVANSGSFDHIVDGKVSSIRTGSGLPGHQVTALMEDRGGNMWVGVDDALYLFKDGRFRRLAEPNHQPLGMVIALTEDIDGNVWAQCIGNPRKLVRIRNFQVREELPAPQFPPGRAITADPHGGIWIASLNEELALFRNGTLQKFSLPPNSSPARNQIIAKPDGSVLAASEDGLVGLRHGKVRRMTTENGLPCNAVISFVEDRDQRWWLYTRCGVLELPDSELQKWWANPETVVQTRLYDVLDGAQPNDPSFTPAAYSSDGRVWFATGVVVQVVDPSVLSQKALPAQTYIESLVADRKEFDAKPNLEIPPNPRDLQIDYTSPTFTIPQRVKFRYRLDGYDREWHDAGTRRQAFYTDLPPGKYSFRVSASNSDGVWSGSAAKLDFSVSPAYYQTNWFRTACVAAFFAMIWGIYQLRVRQLAAQFNMRLEERLAERTRIARDLHDTLLQGFQGLLLRLQAVLIQIPKRPEKASEILQSALISADQAIAEGRSAVRELRSGAPSESSLEQMLLALGRELASSQPSGVSAPSLRVIVEGSRRAKRAVIRDEVHRIARELLRNAYRHAHAQNIEAELRYDDDAFLLVIRDDGKGIEPQVLKDHGRAGHWGVPGMYERAEGIGARLDFWSEVGAGTEVRLRVPASIAYEKSGDSGRFKLFRKTRTYEHR